MKLIDADKLREQLIGKIDAIFDMYGEDMPKYQSGRHYAYAETTCLIDKAPDFSLTWEDVRQLVRTADSIITRETGKYRDEQAYYEEVLRRFNAKE